MRKLSKKRIEAIWAATNMCYNKALREEYPTLLSNFSDDTDTLELKIVVSQNSLPMRSESINNRYLAHLRELDSDMLALVVEADKQKAIRRSPVTIDAILNELLERSANSDPTTDKIKGGVLCLYLSVLWLVVLFFF